MSVVPRCAHLPPTNPRYFQNIQHPESFSKYKLRTQEATQKEQKQEALSERKAKVQSKQHLGLQSMMETPTLKGPLGSKEQLLWPQFEPQRFLEDPRVLAG